MLAPKMSSDVNDAKVKQNSYEKAERLPNKHESSMQVNGPIHRKKAELILPGKDNISVQLADFGIWSGDVEAFLSTLPNEPLFDLIVSSPPYNIGKSYESKKDLKKYLEWQERIIDLMRGC
jgi:hypothetical protein